MGIYTVLHNENKPTQFGFFSPAWKRESEDELWSSGKLCVGYVGRSMLKKIYSILLNPALLLTAAVIFASFGYF